MKNTSYDKKVFRLMYILNQLNSSGSIRVRELASEFNTNPRTVQRDLVLLEAAGFHLTCEGWEYRFADGFALQKIAVTPQERYLLNLFCNLFSKTNTSLSAISKEFLNKVILSPKAEDKKMVITSREKEILKGRVDDMSRSIKEYLDDKKLSPEYTIKVEEFLASLEKKLGNFEQKRIGSIKFRKTGLYDHGMASAIFSVPRKYFHAPEEERHFYKPEPTIDFKVIPYRPTKDTPELRIWIKTELRFHFFGQRIRERGLTIFDRLGKHLGFSGPDKRLWYFYSYKKGCENLKITRADFHWVKKLQVLEKESSRLT